MEVEEKDIAYQFYRFIGYGIVEISSENSPLEFCLPRILARSFWQIHEDSQDHCLKRQKPATFLVTTSQMESRVKTLPGSRQ